MTPTKPATTAADRAERLVRGLAPALGALLLAVLLGACTGTRLLTHPTVLIEGPAGQELGASTDYGVVFLGRSVRTGEVELTVWYGDGPDIERTIVEPVGEGLYTAETEIAIPSVPIDFGRPVAGEVLLMIGLDAEGRLWEAEVSAVVHDSVTGILIAVPPVLSEVPDQTGAGIYRLPDGERRFMRLVGLVSGRLRLATTDGPSEYLTVVGARDLWRLVTRRRSEVDRNRWIYRDDIL
jgi:hypothetical protein